MKIKKHGEESKSVTITLETQEELDLFAEVFYRVGGQQITNVFGDTVTIFNSLIVSGAEHPDNNNLFEVSGEIYID